MSYLPRSRTVPEVGIRELLEAGVHFGHQTRRWNPKMRRFIHGERGGIYIIDLLQTQELLEHARTFAGDIAAKGGAVLFVGTKKQARDAVKETAEDAGMPYVNHRWLGGLLTNWNTISRRIQRLHDLEKYASEGQLDLLPTKERMTLQADLVKLQANLGGVKNMQRVPDAMFVVDLKTEAIAVREAQRLRIPIIALADTNTDPDGVAYVVPGNDDAIRSCALITKAIGERVKEGAQKYRIAEEQAKREAEEKARREQEERERREAEEQARREAEEAAASGAADAEGEGAPASGAPATEAQAAAARAPEQPRTEPPGDPVAPGAPSTPEEVEAGTGETPEPPQEAPGEQPPAGQEASGGGVGAAARDLAASAQDAVSDVTGGVVEGAQDVAGTAQEVAGDVAGGKVADAARDAASGAAEAAGDVASGAADAARDVAGGVVKAVSDLTGGGGDDAEGEQTTGEAPKADDEPKTDDEQKDES